MSCLNRLRAAHGLSAVVPTPPARSEESPQLRHPLPDSAWERLADNLRVEVDGAMQDLASRIRSGIQSLDATMSRYCEATCAHCSDPCCEGRSIFYNHCDLLTLVASGSALPPGQTRTCAPDPCRYLRPDGCTLPRVDRPYVCVWFLCEPQMALFQEESAAFQRWFIRVLQEIRDCRLRLESLYEQRFLQALTRS